MKGRNFMLFIAGFLLAELTKHEPHTPSWWVAMGGIFAAVAGTIIDLELERRDRNIDR